MLVVFSPYQYQYASLDLHEAPSTPPSLTRSFLQRKHVVMSSRNEAFLDMICIVSTEKPKLLHDETFQLFEFVPTAL